MAVSASLSITFDGVGRGASVLDATGADKIKSEILDALPTGCKRASMT
jgi:hypothetical protein